MRVIVEIIFGISLYFITFYSDEWVRLNFYLIDNDVIIKAYSHQNIVIKRKLS